MSHNTPLGVTQSAQILAQIIHTALSLSPDIGLILGSPARIYDSAPEDPVFPYLSYGAMRSLDIGADDTALISHQISLHLWSRYDGRAELLSGLNYIAQALAIGQLKPRDGLTVISANPIYLDVLRAPDGRTMHGLLRMSFSTQLHIKESL